MKLTVGQLRKLIEGVQDDVPVRVYGILPGDDSDGGFLPWIVNVSKPNELPVEFDSTNRQVILDVFIPLTMGLES